MIDTATLLFIIRLAAGCLLLALLIALFAITYRDLINVSLRGEESRRVYGRLTVLETLHNETVVTHTSYPLLAITSLGRSPTNTVVIDDHFASAEHAVVALRNGHWWLEDRQSRNGTLLNGLPVTQPVIVTDRDIISIGQARFRLELDA
jgi:hypothetical protein